MKKPIQDLPLFFVNPTSKIMLDKKIIGEGGWHAIVLGIKR